MSRILDKLRAAEEERERIIAERRRLEAEANTALAEQDREVRALRQHDSLPQPAVPIPPRRPLHLPWAWALTAVAFLAVAIFVLPERNRVPAAPAAPAVPMPAEVRPQPGLKLDRDLDAFAARVRAAGKP